MNNVHKQTPAIILIIALVGFPQISESIFTPALPNISNIMLVSAKTSQLTMSSYFIGFALGVLFWGRLSDYFGRRPAMMLGIITYLIGNIGLLLSNNFTLFMTARIVQAFGAAAGSVITQTIMRESFSGIYGERVFAKVSAAMAISPALGPLLGGSLLSYFNNYHSIFKLLITMSILLILSVAIKLPETRVINVIGTAIPWQTIALRMIKSPQVWVYCLIISGINGILFSYYAEAPFIFENHFGLTSFQFGWLGLVVGVASILGAITTNRLAGKISSNNIVDLGLIISLIGALSIFLTTNALILLLISVFITFVGINIALPIALSRALIGFEDVIGTASGLLSFIYYLVISSFTFLMSFMHDGTVFALPRYLVIIISLMLIGKIFFNIKNRHKCK